MKRIIALLLLMPFGAFAQTAEKSFWDDPFTSPLLPLYIVTALVFITIILVLVVAINMVRILNIVIQNDYLAELRPPTKQNQS